MCIIYNVQYNNISLQFMLISSMSNTVIINHYYLLFILFCSKNIVSGARTRAGQEVHSQHFWVAAEACFSFPCAVG